MANTAAINPRETLRQFGRSSGVATSKIDRYKWTVKDDPGALKLLHKTDLKIHPSYQRHAAGKKVVDIASSWSWIACGAIVVADRGGEFWVIDGQHRVLAAKNRADIDLLPCVVFATESVAQEAQGFLDLNTQRKAMSSIDRFRALLVAGNDIAIFVDSEFKRLGIVANNSGHGTRNIKSVGLCMTMAQIDKEMFSDTLSLVALICADCPIKERLLSGLGYIRQKVGAIDGKLHKRIVDIGQDRLNQGAMRAAAFYKRGGAKVFATGMLEEINKGLQKRYAFKE